MRRFTAGIICLAIIMLSLPGMAQAETTPKEAFINDFTAYVDSSTKMQEAMVQALQQNTIKFALDANLTDARIALEDGTTLSNIPGHASLAMAFNLSDPQASLDFSATASEYSLKGQVFFTKDGLIVPRETIWSLADTGADFENLGDLNKLPPYVVYEMGMSEQELNQVRQIMKDSTASQAEQIKMVKALIQEILEIIPDQCFYFSGSKPVMDLTRVSLTSPELLNNLKDHKETLADQFATSMAKPATMSDAEYAQMQTEIRNGIVTGIDSITAEAIGEAMKEFPVSIQKCQIIASPAGCESSLALKSTLPDGSSFTLASNSDGQINGNTANSKGTMDFAIKATGLDMSLHIDTKSSMNPSKADFTFIVSGKGGDKKNLISGKLNINGAMDWSSKSPIQIPQITAQNSKKVKMSNAPITIFINNETLSLDSDPMLKNGVTVVPLRNLAKALDCQVDWQAPDTVIISKESSEDLIMRIDSTTYQIGNDEYYMEEAPFIFDDRVYVPLRVVAEYCALTVQWNSTKQEISLWH